MELIQNRETTLAVLPFQIIGATENISPIIKGFTDDLIINFSKFIGLSVISQYSSIGIQDIYDSENIAKLGADYLITGSFRTTSKGFRISIQLVRSKDNKIVFAGNHDETMESILNTQDAITQQMVSVLQQQIEYDLLSYSYKKEAVELAAYENWLLGMDEIKKGTIESDLKARAYFENALKINPNFARAYTGISLSYFNEWSCQMWDRWELNQKGAHDHALKAIELDENDYVSLSVLGRSFAYLGEYTKAEHVLRKSLRMNPSDADNLILISNCFVWLGYLEEAEQLYNKARNLNPLQPEAYLLGGLLIYFEKGEFEKALEMGEKVSNLGIWTDFTAFLSAICYHLGKFDKMKDYWKLYKGYFQKNINKGKPATDKEAVEWQHVVNPYKNKTQLEPFWDHILGGDLETSKPSSYINTTASTGSFIQKGEFWEIQYANQTATLKDCKGLHDIAQLLQEPEKDFHCTDLMGTVFIESGTPLIDEKAKKEYKQQALKLQVAISDAEEIGLYEKADALREELESFSEQLSQTVGLSNKIRKTGSSIEKARAAVTWRIRNAIKKIEKSHPKLAKHLTISIKTGGYCSYTPEVPHDWTF
ncbi:tetratricopeptide repeat protein [Allomuricauda sp. NBRC 101325]|uniref:tetratricopeptide repeat protein n=1 Tax=Allomuricauda sp. NBRC 101325 TaxID=1113758 RepID=UPI002556DB43|nr:tetratricopeptide repeat protein [Muricauda sp. NBRC 101325]